MAARLEQALPSRRAVPINQSKNRDAAAWVDMMKSKWPGDGACNGKVASTKAGKGVFASTG